MFLSAIKFAGTFISALSAISIAIWFYVGAFRSPKMSIFTTRSIVFAPFIFGRSYYFQMRRINANSISAKMIDMISFWNALTFEIKHRKMSRSVSNFIVRNSVGVTIVGKCANPIPTPVRNFFSLSVKSHFSSQMYNAHNGMLPQGGI